MNKLNLADECRDRKKCELLSEADASLLTVTFTLTRLISSL